MRQARIVDSAELWHIGVRFGERPFLHESLVLFGTLASVTSGSSCIFGAFNRRHVEYGDAERSIGHLTSPNFLKPIFAS